jgi:hypothetical protein
LIFAFLYLVKYCYSGVAGAEFWKQLHLYVAAALSPAAWKAITIQKITFSLFDL